MKNKEQHPGAILVENKPRTRRTKEEIEREKEEKKRRKEEKEEKRKRTKTKKKSLSIELLFYRKVFGKYFLSQEPLIRVSNGTPSSVGSSMDPFG